VTPRETIRGQSWGHIVRGIEHKLRSRGSLRAQQRHVKHVVRAGHLGIVFNTASNSCVQLSGHMLQGLLA
jgi:hypothetical protein